MDQLRKLVGKIYLHNGSQIKIENYTENKGNVTIVTDKGFIDKTNAEIPDFIESLQPIEGAMSVIPQMKIDTGTIGSLKDILMENISKVKADASYIPQSEEINKNVKSIIDLAKTELDMIKTFRGI
jgi:hypothetical protein